MFLPNSVDFIFCLLFSFGKNRAKDKIKAFIESPDNKIALEIKFEKVKQNFFLPPSAETAHREKALSSLTNIVLLFIQAKLTEVNYSCMYF